MGKRFKNQTSFVQEGAKRLFCPNCGSFLTKTYIGEKQVRSKKCRVCKTETHNIKPPKKAVVKEQEGYFFGPISSMWTAI